MFGGVNVEAPGRLLGIQGHCQYYIHPGAFPQKPVIYCGGLGNQIEFELDLIRYYKCRVFGFDPTHESAKYIDKLQPENFVFCNVGLSDRDGEERFKVVKKKSKYYAAVEIHLNQSAEGEADQVETFRNVRIPTAMKKLGHRKIDLFKIDIEGAEYRVIDDLLENEIYPSQIALEWHFRHAGNGSRRRGIEITEDYVERLKKAGYYISFIGKKPSEMTLIHRKALRRVGRYKISR